MQDSWESPCLSQARPQAQPMHPSWARQGAAWAPGRGDNPPAACSVTRTLPHLLLGMSPIGQCSALFSPQASGQRARGPTQNGCHHHLMEGPGKGQLQLHQGQVLTSHIEGSLTVERVVFAEVVHGHGAAAIDGEIHHLIKGDQLNGVELSIIDRLGTGRR